MLFLTPTSLAPPSSQDSGDVALLASAPLLPIVPLPLLINLKHTLHLFPLPLHLQIFLSSLPR